jgi:hypothetical protein
MILREPSSETFAPNARFILFTSAAHVAVGSGSLSTAGPYPSGPNRNPPPFGMEPNGAIDLLFLDER